MKKYIFDLEEIKEYIKDENQMRNTSRNIFLTYNNITKTVAEWSRDIKISESTIRSRMKKFSVETDMDKIFNPNHFNRWSNMS